MGRFATTLVLTVLGIGLVPGAAWAGAGLPTEKAAPGIGIRLVDVPVATANDPRARSYIVDHLDPGTVIHRRVEVSNGTPSVAHVATYAGAAQIRGGVFTDAVGRTQNELSSWTSLDRRSSVLAPQQRTMVDVTIRVPRDASRGERYAVVWAEVRSSPNSMGVVQVSRVGVRIYLSVGPGGADPTDFQITSMTPGRDAEGAPLLRATVRNTGERAVDLTGRLRLTQGPGGLSAGPILSETPTTLGVHQIGTVAIVLDKQLPPGPWLARVSITSGLLTRTAQARVTFPSRPGTGRSISTRAGSAPPAWASTGAAVLLGLMVLLVLARRRRANAGSLAAGTTPEGM